METDAALVVFARRGSEPVVLKVFRDPEDQCASVLSAFGGLGMVRLLDRFEGAALMERLTPGTALLDLVLQGNDAEATEILADSIQAMPVRDAPAGCPRALDWAESFASYGGSQIPRRLLEDAEERYRRLCSTTQESRLLHGDLHHGNVLHDARRGWVVIDPKGVVSELEYEIGAALRNPGEAPDLFASRTTIDRRLAQLSRKLSLNAARALEWTFVQAILSLVWSWEDGQPFDACDGRIRLAQTILPML